MIFYDAFTNFFKMLNKYNVGLRLTGWGGGGGELDDDFFKDKNVRGGS